MQLNEGVKDGIKNTMTHLFPVDAPGKSYLFIFIWRKNRFL